MHPSDRESGFTMVELLVVVIIVGVLAAIAIPTFLQQRDRAYEAHAVSSIGLAAVAQQSYFTASTASYTTDVADLVEQGFVLGPNLQLATNGDANRYCVLAQDERGGRAFLLRSDGAEAGVMQRVARIPGTPTTCALD
jgi:type IV pilus assembly protein PilA